MAQVDFRSSEDIYRYVQDLSGRKVEDSPKVRLWRIAERITWALLLATAFLVYYLLDLTNEALSMPHVGVNVVRTSASIGWILVSSA
jgi:hypothetical protein